MHTHASPLAQTVRVCVCAAFVQSAGICDSRRHTWSWVCLPTTHAELSPLSPPLPPARKAEKLGNSVLPYKKDYYAVVEIVCMLVER